LRKIVDSSKNWHFADDLFEQQHDVVRCGQYAQRTWTFASPVSKLQLLLSEFYDAT
jgi:hypothetical protein